MIYTKKKKIVGKFFCVWNICLTIYIICLTATLGETLCPNYCSVTVLFPDDCVSSTGRVVPTQEIIHMGPIWASTAV